MKDCLYSSFRAWRSEMGVDRADCPQLAKSIATESKSSETMRATARGKYARVKMSSDEFSRLKRGRSIAKIGVDDPCHGCLRAHRFTLRGEPGDLVVEGYLGDPNTSCYAHAIKYL